MVHLRADLAEDRHRLRLDAIERRLGEHVAREEHLRPIQVRGAFASVRIAAVGAEQREVVRRRAVERELGEHAAELRRELERVPGPDAQQHAILPGHPVDDEVAVGGHRVQAGLDVALAAEGVREGAAHELEDALPILLVRLERAAIGGRQLATRVLCDLDGRLAEHRESVELGSSIQIQIGKRSGLESVRVTMARGRSPARA